MAKITTSGGDAVAIFEMSASVSQTKKNIEDAAHYLWDLGQGDHGTEETPIQFGNLKEADHLAILEQHLRRVIIDSADTFVSQAAQTAARIGAETHTW